MASKRRGGFRPPELRGTLGTLIRTTTGVVRDALERGAREGRARLDDVRTSRRRQDALADLGELVLDLIRRGEIDLAELPEAHDLVRRLDDLDAEGSDEPAPLRAAIRRRFDDRAADEDDGTVSSGTSRATRPTTPARPHPGEPVSSRAPTRPMKPVWRPPIDDHDRQPSHHDEPADEPGRTARSEHGHWTDRVRREARGEPGERGEYGEPGERGEPARRGRGQPAQRERADFADHGGHRERAGSSDRERAGSSAPDRAPGRPGLADPDLSPRRRAPIPRDPGRQGGISFDDDDEDLADYMHPDDVPSKTSSSDPDDHSA